MSHYSRSSTRRDLASNKQKGFTPTPISNNHSGNTKNNDGVSITQNQWQKFGKIGVSPAKAERGFTLMELLISISIVTVILTVVVMNQSTYTDTNALSNLSYQISSDIAQARAYGIGVRELTPGSNEFTASYGLAFSLLGSGSDKAYISFADRNENGIYDDNWSCSTGGTSECLGKTDITRNNYIASLCVIRSSGSDLCNVGRIDITFVRPSTEAQIEFFNNGGQSFNPAGMIGARIVLNGPDSLTRSVKVYSTGQISVQ
jgi:prepilin-type N-terminal cleavage/methylation domain-containing protein